VKLHLAVSDTVGVTGMRIIRAILSGKHNPSELAALREPSCKNSEETFVKALTGNYRAEHLFALKQAMELFTTYQDKIKDCDAEIAAALSAFDKTANAKSLAPKPAKRRRKNQPHFDGRTLLYEITGVDLTLVPALEASSILTIISETRPISARPFRCHQSYRSQACPHLLLHAPEQDRIPRIGCRLLRATLPRAST
jgi:hypothetical protein